MHPSHSSSFMNQSFPQRTIPHNFTYAPSYTHLLPFHLIYTHPHCLTVVVCPLGQSQHPSTQSFSRTLLHSCPQNSLFLIKLPSHSPFIASDLLCSNSRGLIAELTIALPFQKFCAPKAERLVKKIMTSTRLWPGASTRSLTDNLVSERRPSRLPYATSTLLHLALALTSIYLSSLLLQSIPTAEATLAVRVNASTTVNYRTWDPFQGEAEPYTLPGVLLLGQVQHDCTVSVDPSAGPAGQAILAALDPTRSVVDSILVLRYDWLDYCATFDDVSFDVAAWQCYPFPANPSLGHGCPTLSFPSQRRQQFL